MLNQDIEQLDAAICAVMAGRAIEHRREEGDLWSLFETASNLRFLPRTDFRSRLCTDLLAEAATRAAERSAFQAHPTLMRSQLNSRSAREFELPPLFGTGTSMLPVRGSNLAASFVLHVVALAIVFTSGWWMVKNSPRVRTQIASGLSESVRYILPVAPGEIRGGGGGGTQDKLPASHGSAPRFANDQLTPPSALVMNDSPKLPAEPTVVGPPDLKLPQLDQTGDPMAAILHPSSNGTGKGGGIGSGAGGGVGVGSGPGVGDGVGGGLGGGIFRVGGGVSAPRAIYDPDPEYSEQARKAKYQGSVLLWAIIDAEGHPRDLRIARSLGMGLDEKATEAVGKWRFAPAVKDGRPVAVQIGIEVVFRLY